MSFKGFINTNKLRFFFITFLSILSGTSGILAGYVQMYWLTYVKEKEWFQVGISTTLMALCWFFARSVIYFVQYLNNLQEEEYFKKIRDSIAKHYFEDGRFHKVSDYQNRLTNDFSIIKDNYFEWYVVVPFYGSMFVMSLIALATIHWSIFILSVVIDVFSYFLPKIINKKLEQAAINVSNKNNEYLDALSKWFSGLSELRRYFAGGKLLKVQDEHAKKLEKANVNQVVQQQLLSILNGVSILLSTILLLGITGILIAKKVIIFGAILSIQNFANNVSFGMQETIEGLTMMKSCRPLMKKINKDITNSDYTREYDKSVPYSIETFDLEINFPNGENLKYPDLKINNGEKILLSGDSGSGKTTLIKLLLGIVSPSQGRIVFKDKEGNTIKPNLSKIGYVPQDPNLFPGTIKQNITMFNEKLDDKVDAIIKDVNLNKDLNKFDAGINTPLNLDKMNISGGQRQKIILARAKIHNSQIILIDEGTSAIDKAATLNILKKFLQSEATIIFIAHNFDERMHNLFDREIQL